MAKLESKKLFELIKSLSKKEKRNFKLFSREWKKDIRNNHLRLFDIIESQQVYNEQRIRDRYSDEKFARNLPVTKVHLYNALLKSFIHYNILEIPRGKLWRSMIMAEVLFSKKLYDQCMELNNKIKKKCYQQEEFALLLESLRLEERLVRRGSMRVLYPRLKEIFQEEKTIILQLQNINEYKLLNRNLFELMGFYGIQDKKSMKEGLRKIMNNSILKDINKAHSVKAKSIFYHIHGAYGFAAEKLDYAARYNQKRLELMEQYPLSLMTNKGEHQNLLFNLSSIYFEQKKLNSAAQFLNKYELLYGENIKSLMFKIQICVFRGDIKKATELIKNASMVVKANHSDSFRLQFIAIVAVVFFVSGNFKKAKYWNNQILTLSDTSYNLDLFLFVRLLALLIYFEQKEFELMEPVVRSLKKRLQKISDSDTAVNLMVNFAYKIQKHHKHSELLLSFKKLKKDLDKLRGTSGGRMLEYLDISTWVQSKIENKTFAEVAAEYYNAKRAE